MGPGEIEKTFGKILITVFKSGIKCKNNLYHITIMVEMTFRFLGIFDIMPFINSFVLYRSEICFYCTVL